MIANMSRLPRSLDPIPGESLRGFILRLSIRLGIAPSLLMERLGLRGTGRALRRVQFDLGDDLPGFAVAARLAESEAAKLTVAGVHGRTHTVHSFPWLSLVTSRVCPECLRGTPDAPGTWLLAWTLPWTFACLRHQRLLVDTCPHCGNEIGREGAQSSSLVPSPAVNGVGLSKCRFRLTNKNGHRFSALNLCLADLADPEPFPATLTRMALQAQRILNEILGTPDGLPPSRTPTFFGQTIAVAEWTALLQQLVVLGRAGLGLPSATVPVGFEDFARRAGKPATSGADATSKLITGRPQAGDLAVHAYLTSEALQALQSTSWEELADQLGPVRDAVREHMPGVYHKWLSKTADPRVRSVLKPHKRWGLLSTAISKTLPTKTVEISGRNVPNEIPQQIRSLLDPFRAMGSSKKSLYRVLSISVWQRLEYNGRRADAAVALGIPLDHVYRTFASVQQNLEASGLAEAFLATVDIIVVRLAENPVDYSQRRSCFADWTISDEDWHSLLRQMQAIRRTSGKTTDWDRRRGFVNQYLWQTVTGGERTESPIRRNLGGRDQIVFMSGYQSFCQSLANDPKLTTLLAQCAEMLVATAAAS